MGIFSKKRKEEKTFEVESVETRLDVLKAERELMTDFAQELETDIKNFMIKEDMIDEDYIELIPVIKKYAKKFDNLVDLSYKSAEIEIEKYEALEEALIKLTDDNRLLRSELKETNKTLERIAKALEKK